VANATVPAPQVALPPPNPFTPAPNGTPEQRAAIALWLRTLERPPEVRIALYRDFLTHNPTSPYRSMIVREILALGALGGASTATPPIAAAPAPVPQGEDDEAFDVAADPARELRVGQAAAVAVQLAPGRPAHSGILSVRQDDEADFSAIVMRVEQDGYLRARVPAQYVTPPGFFYFVEVVDGDGRARPALASADEPVYVAVARPGGPADSTRGRSRIDLRSEFADVGSRTFEGRYRPEWFLLTEGDFFQRIRFHAIYGYRVGFGVYTGMGQPLSAYEPGDETPARSATVVYGYHELELGIVEMVHAMLRVEVGIHEQGLVGGGQLRLRIGDEQRTNIVVGGDVMDEVGQKATFAFTFFPAERLPILALGEVFNQTIDGGDPMFRLVTQVGYRFERWVSLALRGSYQLRNVSHGGFGGGAAINLDW
jgi:hypothetical protein